MYYSEYYISDKFAILVHKKYEISKHRESVLQGFSSSLYFVCVCVGVCVCMLSCVWLFAAPRTIQPMEFPRLEYWSG